MRNFCQLEYDDDSVYTLNLELLSVRDLFQHTNGPRDQILNLIKSFERATIGKLISHDSFNGGCSWYNRKAHWKFFSEM